MSKNLNLDPTSAFSEVLNPNQNQIFRIHVSQVRSYPTEFFS
jgi:hypothetical protein